MDAEQCHEGGRVLRGRLRRSPVVNRGPSVRPARVAQLLALAHRWQRQIQDGEVSGQVDIARREGVTAARVSQVMGLLGLSPWRQEEVLGMVAVDGKEPVAGRELRGVAESWV